VDSEGRIRKALAARISTIAAIARTVRAARVATVEAIATIARAVREVIAA
jgi:hypothetical protein